MTPDLAIVDPRLQQLAARALRGGWPAGAKPVPAQYNAAHALSKQDGQRARADGADSAALH